MVTRGGRSFADQRGVAMLEFVLMLPFIFVVLLLIVNFGQALGERQRTVIALRELAIRHSFDVPNNGGDASINPVANQLAADTLAAHHLTAEFSLDQPEAGTCPRREKEEANEEEIGAILGELTTFLKNISASHSYRTEARGTGIAGGLLPQPIYTACVAIDTSPWTIHETGGPDQWLTGLVGKLGNLF